MSDKELRARAQRRLALLQEIEQVRKLQARVGIGRAHRAHQQLVQRMTRLLG